MAGGHVTTQHKPVKQTNTVDHKTIKWWRCKDNVAVVYKDQVTVRYEEFSEEVGVWRTNEKSTKKHL